ncbi:lasso peptide biosynthesis B2 protein [Embleya sp. NPDC050493]|uniref:lasso peptide biosynthesis B2 protein n=1 Tax=Embleya sp. NPDC050493 TaxID=3363989 RepID=UPI0037966D9F
MSIPMVAPPEPEHAPPLGCCVAGRIGLRLALAAQRLPLRTRLRLASACGHLPQASHARTSALYAAVTAAGTRCDRRTACWETALGTVFACALTGGSTTLVLGARPLPWAAHAWIRTPEGELGITVEDAERPWLPILFAPTRKASN